MQRFLCLLDKNYTPKGTKFTPGGHLHPGGQSWPLGARLKLGSGPNQEKNFFIQFCESDWAFASASATRPSSPRRTGSTGSSAAAWRATRSRHTFRQSRSWPFARVSRRHKASGTLKGLPFILPYFFVANTFQIQPFHKGLAIRADVAINYQCWLHWYPVKFFALLSKNEKIQYIMQFF
jgi:hypothetical protein